MPGGIAASIAKTWCALKTKAAGAGLTPSNLLLTAYAEVLGTWARSDDFTHQPHRRRPEAAAPEVGAMLGVFTNLTPLEIRGARRGSFRTAPRSSSDSWRPTSIISRSAA